MAEEGLDGTDVGAALQEVGGERMAEGMTGGTFGDGRFTDGIGELSLEGVFMEVIASVVAGPRMRAEFSGREDELPGPFTRGVWVLAGEGFGHVDLADAGDEVEVVFAMGGAVGLEAGFEGFGERDEAVVTAFGVVDGNTAVAEGDVLDAVAGAVWGASENSVAVEPGSGKGAGRGGARRMASPTAEVREGWKDNASGWQRKNPSMGPA
jgi:hypothetical protein